MNPIIVPLRDAIQYTKRAHPTFISQDIPVSILYINNASTDGTVEWLHSVDCIRIHNQPAKSVAASWNQGLKWWFKQGAEYALVVNNDVELRPDTYRLLLEDGGGFVTAVGNNDFECVKPPYNPPEKPKRPHPDHSCFLIRKWVWNQVGPFDESYKGAYVEDAEFHLKLHKAGVEAYCIDLPFYHIGAGTLRMVREREAKEIMRQADENRSLFKKRHGVAVGTPEYYALFGNEDPSKHQSE